MAVSNFDTGGESCLMWRLSAQDQQACRVRCGLSSLGLNFKPVVIDKAKTCGGLQLSNPYSNTWIATTGNATGGDIAQEMHKNLIAQGVEMRMEREVVSASFAEDKATVLLGQW